MYLSDWLGPHLCACTCLVQFWCLPLYLRSNNQPLLAYFHFYTWIVGWRARRPACLHVCLPVCLPASLPACLPTYLSTYLLACLPGCLYVRTLVCSFPRYFPYISYVSYTWPTSSEKVPPSSFFSWNTSFVPGWPMHTSASIAPGLPLEPWAQTRVGVPRVVS